MRKCLMLVLFLTWTSSVRGQVSVSGEITGSDGTPMSVAHVEVSPYSSGRFFPARMIAAHEGRYQLDLNGTGLYKVRFIGPLHGAHDVVVWVEDTLPFTLDVQLQRDWLDPDQSFTRVLTEEQDFSYDAGEPLVEQPDGSYTAVVPTTSDTLAYYLEGARVSRYAGLVFADLTAHTFRYKGDGVYIALVPNSGKEVTIMLTPERLEAEEAPEPVVAFGGNPHAAAVWALYTHLDTISPYNYTVPSGQESTEEERQRQEADRKNLMRQEMIALEVAIDRADDDFERQLLLFEYLSRGAVQPIRWWAGRYRRIMGVREVGPPTKPAYVQKTFEIIPPTSLLWGLQPSLLYYLAEATNHAPEALTYIETAIAEHPMGSVRQFTLFNLLQGAFAEEGMTERVADYISRYQILTGDIPADLPVGQDSRVVVGRRMPDLGTMPWGVDRRIRSDSLQGKVVLLDFAKSDCDACADDQLRLVAETYAEKGLEVVQINLDMDWQSTNGTAASLPWQVVQGEDGFNSQIAKAFEVMHVPHRILIDQDGVILAVGGDLLGDQLGVTLRGEFGD